MPSDREDQVGVQLQLGGARVDPEPSLDEWSDEFRACLGAWDEEIARPPQGVLHRSDSEETEETNDAV